MFRKNDGEPFTEAGEQQAFCAWLDKHKVLYHAIPNGGYKLSKRQGAGLKYRGVKAGVPDLFICEPIGKYSGLYVEMKRMRCARPKPIVSALQKHWIQTLNRNGYRAVVAYGAEEAIEVAREYLGVDDD